MKDKKTAPGLSFCLSENILAQVMKGSSVDFITITDDNGAGPFRKIRGFPRRSMSIPLRRSRAYSRIRKPCALPCAGLAGRLKHRHGHDVINGIADQIRGIDAASEDQSASGDGIDRSLGEINTSASETAAAMRALSDATRDLTGQARELQELVRQLRTR